MTWSEGDEARKLYKFIQHRLLEPEDLKHNELRILRQYFPEEYAWIKHFLEQREEMIRNGEWTAEHEPVKRKQRINRYDAGDGIVDKWENDT